MPDNLPPKNLDKWRYFLSECPSPNDYINFGFYFMIASTLQRKVWIGDELNALYPNIYVVFVGAAGIGKGLVLKQITSCLRHWDYAPIKIAAEVEEPKAKLQLTTVKEPPTNFVSARDQGKVIPTEAQKKDADREAADRLMAEVTEIMNQKDKKEAMVSTEKKLLIPCGPDTTTFERLIQKMAESYRTVQYPKKFPDGRPGIGIYGHSSLSVQLEEMGTLFRKKTEDIVTLFQKAYDCGDIEYETISRRKDYVKKCCLNFCAGATPDFMRQVFNDELFNQGISSRGWFLYAHSNRFSKMFFSDYTPEQLQAREYILQHIKKLNNVYGRVTFAPDAVEFLRQWWEVDHHSGKRHNYSEKLNHYYSRKNIHIQKMAMLIHFADIEFDEKGKCLMVISLEEVKEAFRVLNAAEKNMHLALQLRSTNALAPIAKKVIRALEVNKVMNFEELHVAFWEDAKEGEMREILNSLLTQDKIIREEKEGVVIYYLKIKPPEEEPQVASEPVVA